MRAKLGLRAGLDGDEAFIGQTFSLLQQNRPDFTTFFRRLSGVSGVQPQEGIAAVNPKNRPKTEAALRDLFIEREACDAWLQDWRARLAQTPWDDAERQVTMLAANPKYVLRNWVAEKAIQRAREKDFSEVRRVLTCLRKPFDEQPEYEEYAAPPPDWANGLAVSCSS